MADPPYSKIKHETDKDNNLMELVRCGWPDSISEVSSEARRWWAFPSQLGTLDGILYIRVRE